MAVNKITATLVNARQDDHEQKHADLLDPMLKNLDAVVFGEKHDNGLCADVKEIKNGYATMRSIGIAILIALLINVIVPLVK
jgi:hypothetical protein